MNYFGNFLPEAPFAGFIGCHHLTSVVSQAESSVHKLKCSIFNNHILFLCRYLGLKAWNKYNNFVTLFYLILYRMVLQNYLNLYLIGIHGSILYWFFTFIWIIDPRQHNRIRGRCLRAISEFLVHWQTILVCFPGAQNMKSLLWVGLRKLIISFFLCCCLKYSATHKKLDP